MSSDHSSLPDRLAQLLNSPSVSDLELLEIRTLATDLFSRYDQLLLTRETLRRELELARSSDA